MAKKKQTAKQMREAGHYRLRSKQILEMRRAGMTYEAIGEHFGVSLQAIHKDYQRTVQQIVKETDELAAEQRAIEIDRVMAVMPKYTQLARNGDHKAAEVLIKLWTRLHKLQGVEAPTKQEVTGKDGAPLVDGEAIRAQLLAKIKG